MKNKILGLVALSFIAVSFVNAESSNLSEEDLGTCEDACVAYADHIDMNDGYHDHDLSKWNADRKKCEAKLCNSASISASISSGN